jgi:tetratricopeptide (TPR) repeat protein
VLLAAAQGQVGSDAAPFGGSPYGSYLAGLFAGNQRDLSMAAEFMLESLAYDPDNGQLLNRAFMLVASDGRHAKAVELARRVSARDSDHGLAALVLAVDSIARGAIEDAEAFLADPPDRGLSTVTVPLLKGWLEVAKGDAEAGLEAVAPLKEKTGFSVFHGLHAALMNDVAGREAEALEAYGQVLRLSEQPTLRLALVAGNFFERSGARERAGQIYDEFLVRNPGSLLVVAARRRLEAGVIPAPVVADAAEGVAEALFNLASLLSKERAEEIALVHAHLALRLKPNFVIAQILLGEILQAQRRGREAIAIYRLIPEESPYSWMVGLRVAEELERLDSIDEAVAELERLAAARPGRFEPLFRLGNLLRAKERFEEAVAAYDRALERVGSPERRHWTMFYFRGIALERLKRWPRAEQDFLQALELEPEQPFVMNYLAYTWVDQNLNLDRAKGMLVRAVELRPEDGYIVDSLGWVYYRLGEYRKGVEYLERAVELRPQDPVINDHLGDAYWRVGRRQEARFQWRRALSLGPEEDTAPKIEEKIDRGLGETPEDT